MSGNDMKLLRDELARVIAENRRHRNVEEEMGKNIVDFALKVDQLTLEVDRLTLERDQVNAKADKLMRILGETMGDKATLERLLQFYDNPHSPPSSRTITQREINKEKKEERRRNNPEGRRGRKKGFRGKAVSRRAERTASHRPGRCSSCGGGSLDVISSESRNIIDIPEIPKATVTRHVIMTCRCSSCGTVATPAAGILRGTSLGPNLVRIVAGMWKDKVSYEGIAGTLSGLFGIMECSKSTVQHALDSVAGAMEREVGAIRAEMDAKTTPAGIDETPYSVMGDPCQAWVATDCDTTVVVMAGSRGAAVLEEYFPYHGRPVTADGYAAYKMFGVLQRCWAHLLRESASYARAMKLRKDVSKTDCRDAELLDLRLRQLYREVKAMGTATDAQCRALEGRLMGIAALYPKKLGNKIASAAGNLFTFLKYEGMEPTNNATEREIRTVVIHRKVRGQIGSEGGMQRFGTLLTCILTWRKRKLNFYQELDRVLMA